MERLRANKKRAVTILFFYYTFVPQLLYFLGNGKFSALIFLIVLVISVLHIAYLLATKGFDEDLYFSEEGIQFNRAKGKHIFKWSNVIVIESDRKLVNKIFPTIRICDKTDIKKCDYIPLNFTIRDSLKELLNKYCPQDNELTHQISAQIGKLDSDK